MSFRLISSFRLSTSSLTFLLQCWVVTFTLVASQFLLACSRDLCYTQAFSLITSNRFLCPPFFPFFFLKLRRLSFPCHRHSYQLKRQKKKRWEEVVQSKFQDNTCTTMTDNPARKSICKTWRKLCSREQKLLSSIRLTTGSFKAVGCERCWVWVWRFNSEAHNNKKRWLQESEAVKKKEEEEQPWATHKKRYVRQNKGQRE